VLYRYRYALVGGALLLGMLAAVLRAYAEVVLADEQHRAQV